MARDVCSNLSGDLKDLFHVILTQNRDEVGFYDPTPDVNALYNAGQGRMGTDEKIFINILALRSDTHLRQVFSQYQHLHKRSMQEVIKKEFSGWMEKALVALVEAVSDNPLWVAEMLESSMKGIGTNEKKLTRLVVRYRGPFMNSIKEAYMRRYGKTLAKRIHGETSGDYRKLLLALIGEQ